MIWSPISPTIGAENLAPPGEGKRPRKAGRKAIIILESVTKPFKDLIILGINSLTLKVISKDVIKTNTSISSMVLLVNKDLPATFRITIGFIK